VLALVLGREANMFQMPTSANRHALCHVWIVFLGFALFANQNMAQSTLELPASEQSSDSVAPVTTTQSDAAKVTELQESVEQAQGQLHRLEAELDNPNSEYALAEKEFKAFNDDLERAQEALATSQQTGEPSQIQKAEQNVHSLERRRKLAEDRFNLAIEDRKTIREQRTTLRQKIENDKAALDSMTGDGDSDDSDNERKDVRPSRDSVGNATTHDSDEENHNPSIPKGAHDNEDQANQERDSEEQDEELVKAAADASEKEHEAEAAQEETKSIAARLADIQKLVSQEQKELDLARKKVDLATAAQLALSQELTQRQSEQADQSDLNNLRASISQASQRLIQARLEVTEISDRLNDHRAEQSSLQSEHIVALHEMEKKRHEALAAEGLVESLRNPFTLRNILQWLFDHGPRLLLIGSGMFLVNRLASFFAIRSVRLLTTGTGRGSTMERENRAKTLVGVFQNASTVAIFVSGSLMILDELGANITVLMGGVAVIGLAVAFGAQNLIKDYFYGFVMLLENQYMLNDTVRIGGVIGQVERITLRMTVLRDSDGIVHFIPNGTINSVSNETHGWSRAVCEITVSYRENLGRVTDALCQISNELKADSTFGPLMMEPATEPAIESLGESAVHLKVSVKTFPKKHGTVKQEWLRRIKNRFDELGIEPPIQQRLVHVNPETACNHIPSIANRESTLRRAS
jgi:moderate conductance mechanosensitive channel